MVFQQSAMKSKSIQSGLEQSSLSFQQRVSVDKSLVRKDTRNLAKNLFQSFFLVENEQTKNT